MLARLVSSSWPQWSARLGLPKWPPRLQTRPKAEKTTYQLVVLEAVTDGVFHVRDAGKESLYQQIPRRKEKWPSSEPSTDQLIISDTACPGQAVPGRSKRLKSPTRGVSIFPAPEALTRPRQSS